MAEAARLVTRKMASGVVAMDKMGKMMSNTSTISSACCSGSVCAGGEVGGGRSVQDDLVSVYPSKVRGAFSQCIGGICASATNGRQHRCGRHRAWCTRERKATQARSINSAPV